MIEQVELAATLRNRLADEALAAFPRECCGLIEGARDGNKLRVAQIHSTTNIAVEPDRFEIDPADHIRLLKSLRGTGRDIIGCYHSHPNGRAEPSARDRDYALGDDFLWLIIALESAEGKAEIGAFELRADGHRRIALVAAAA
ncbi:MAG: M67 family metallopeptidase [Rhizomicrobium sp.]|jgi:proteasome lid subunit RPN8/RPN11